MINFKRVIAGLVLLNLSMVSLQAAETVTSLRNKPLQSESDNALKQRWQSDREPIARDYVHQPPLIPHKITGYRIDTNFNKCLTCHSWSNYKKAGATKISQTHFSDREGEDLANVSARRYFCNQCHVPQVEAKPLIENTFEPVGAIKQKR